MTSNLTPEELAEAVAKIAELDAKRTQGEWEVTGYEIHNGIEHGEIVADLQFANTPEVNKSNCMFIAAAPLMAQVIRELWAEREQREKQLRKALHPNGVKYPQNLNWAWLIERTSAMQSRLNELEAHHCEAPRNKRIMELEKECAALAAHQCHKPYGDEYGNMRCEYQDKVAKYESDHPWAKSLQDVVEEQAATIARHRAVMQQARDALAEALDRYTFDREDGTVGYAGPSDIVDVFPDTIAALDSVLKGGA